MYKPLQKINTREAVLTSFIFAALVALFIFLPFLIVDKGFFIYCGDYNSQQIPFYVHVQQFLKDGGGTWDWSTDLGTSVVNAYSFYNLGSPFLWLTLPFPSSWLPFLMVPLFMLKFGSIAAAACLYLLRYAKSVSMAVLVSVVFAFCGFNVYNIFFNHMLDPVVFFPLMLWAMDNLMLEKKTGWFALTVGLALLNSYFFFIGNVVFLLLYFTIQCLFGSYRFTLPSFLRVGFEALLGVGIGMALALPSVLSLMDNPRTENFLSGMNVVLYWHVQQIPAILSSLIVPPDPPYLPNVFTEGAIKWTSMSAYLPIFSIAGVVAYLRSKRGGWLKILLITSLVMALVPILNSAFFAFNASYYSRWFYMPILMMCLASLYALEDKEIDLAFGLKFTIAVTAAWGFLGLIPTEEDGVERIGLGQYTSKFWLTFGTALLGILVFAFIWHRFKNKKQLGSVLLGAVMGFSVVYSVIHISLGKFPQWEGDQYYREQQYEGSEALQLPNDVGFYRIDTYSTYDNLGIWLNKSSLQTFHSVVTPSILEFYPLLGVKRDVSSKPEPAVYALRGLLSTRYTVLPLADREQFEAEDPGSLGWTYLGAQGAFAVYENENFLPLGFTYDAFIPMTTLESVAEEDRAALLLRGIGLTPEQIVQYSHLFDEEVGFSYDEVNYDAYVQDVAQLRETASTYTEADASGFAVNIHLDEENLVFFSVPYDPGFTATIDGEETEVLKVSGGMMAVYASAGTHEIVFQYKTPGFTEGLIISGLCLLILVLYWPLSRRKLRLQENETNQVASALCEKIEGFLAEQQAEQKTQAEPGEDTAQVPTPESSTEPEATDETIKP